MPELPEVETIRKQLGETIMGAELSHLEVRQSKCFEGDRKIRGEIISEITRVGKYLFIKFKSGRGLAIHLKMTGRLVVDVEAYDLLPHTRVVVELVDGRKLFYWDTRMFGYIKFEEDIEAAEQKVKVKMGPDPWEMTEIELLRRLQKTGRSVKEAILDQSLLAGVGNIYANDGLWKARIDPRRKAKTLKLSEVKKLLNSLRTVLERGLATGGASDNSYVDAKGKKGSYQNEFLVYGRTGEPCRRCGQNLIRIVVGGRGTWVCEKCQR
ncbi:MAG: Formamidopyrimidine-DNA glycosylase [Microgenomates group bacterium GW2011_GWA2_46_7]|nr:MAG: Formamidopyrimidine-DNA glycosylase [Microgenomates group bacterium GW2011_GWA2_46_7]